MRLIGEYKMATCPECNGLGAVPCPKTFSTRTASWKMGCFVPTGQPGEGHPIPCPTCRGAKVVPCPNMEVESDES